MRISDWSSDVCSSDLAAAVAGLFGPVSCTACLSARDGRAARGVQRGEGAAGGLTRSGGRPPFSGAWRGVTGPERACPSPTPASEQARKPAYPLPSRGEGQLKDPEGERR